MKTERGAGPVHIGRVLITQEEIDARVRELAHEISTDYAGKTPVFISLLKGGFIFLADLVRHLTISHEVDFITVHSYGDGFSRSERIEIVNDLQRSVAGRDVIVVDGIVDTGHTLSVLEQMLLGREVRSLRICTLLDKPSCREIEVGVHYTGFRVPDVFVVGYGLDFMERYRNLAYIAEVLPGPGAEAALSAAERPGAGGGEPPGRPAAGPRDVRTSRRKAGGAGARREP